MSAGIRNVPISGFPSLSGLEAKGENGLRPGVYLANFRPRNGASERNAAK
jgi:hypothetical protein